ncbi:MAG: hypothetical protein LBO66_13815 [Deltaproteobacteria bacterium]|jgi:uncharacterized iron-regulated protein|nr:hypothetical protein [Deltaproteobacteria bacterium]
MTFSSFLVFVIFAPLILLFLGFLLLCFKIFKSRAQEEETARTLAMAQDLKATLDKLDARLANLEDIIIGPDHFAS